ncbi:MAG: isoleucine--tRNA ligase [Candidatus Altiarchaeales archaeon]|nr:MAG: isoleucine--tRNA ligase [Candidatus Altiarchaeales archaeon]
MPRLNLPEIEEEVQRYWKENSIFNEMVESRRDGKKFYFCQGPPFTSGQAHIGHAWNHALKDMVLRYKTMNGFNVYRRAGWDMHGLPIEVKVEETVLGSKSKKEIEEYGIENFIGECKKFAIRNMNNMTSQLQRLGIWLDWDNPYMTLDRKYMEGVWFGIKRAHEKNLLYEDEQVIHWCPRCETAVAGYEVRDEYKEISDYSIYVKARLRGKENEFILIWTTTPWTLPANTAIAVHPEFNYVKVKFGDEILILVKERLDDALRGEYEILEEFKGKELDSLEYFPILDIPVQEGIHHRVVMAPEIVTLEEGTGCVHIAPGHGEEDFDVGKKYHLDSLSPVDEAGRFTIEPYKGMYIRDANAVIIKDLEDNGRLLREERISHRYPHCWRCKTPLILRSTKQWFLAVSKIRDELLEKNMEIEWIPEWIGSGRFENWLKNAKDWCISRQRYWNTPLPIWRCECGNIEVIGSIKELAEKSVREIDTENLDLHRPQIDKVKLKCTCGKEMSRVKDVIDVWFDSGSASWANLNYPHEKEKFKELFPADFITEGSDQTRGWFYSLLVGSVIAFDEIPYKRVLYHGFTLDANGRKMSKSLGNVVDPSDVIEKHGADVLRFYMLWATVPWEDLCFSWEGVASVERMFNILWNVYSFSKTYMKLDNFNPDKDYELKLEHEDRWILSRFNSLIKDSTDAMERVYPHEFCRSVNDFILELSRWYVKLVRDRVWIEGDDPRKISVYLTLHRILTGISLLMAPVTPHLSEYMYRELTNGRSVHLLDWPVVDENLIDKELEENMEIVQQIVECVSSARQKAKIKLRWPIPRVIIALKEELDLTPFEGIILKACNAKKLEIRDMKPELVVKPNLSVLGPKFKGDARKISEKLKSVDATKVKDSIEKTGEFRIEKFVLSGDDLIFETRIPEDIVAEEFEKGIVYIDSKLSSELFSEAMAREVIRRIQEMRKEMDLEELEIVNIFIKCDKKFKKFIEDNKKFIEKETRGRIKIGKAEGEVYEKKWDIEGNDVLISIVK